MSLQCPVGPESNLLDITPQHCARMMVEMPILSLEEMQALKDSSYRFVYLSRMQVIACDSFF